jgi:hypothetical protein
MPREESNSMKDALQKAYQDMVNKAKGALGDKSDDEERIGTAIASNIDQDKYKGFKRGFGY